MVIKNERKRYGSDLTNSQWNDAGYRKSFEENVRALGLGVDIYECIVPGWRILPKRWLVERALAWMNQSCRLSKDYEITVASVEALCMIVALRSMIARFWYWYGFLYLHEYYPETKEFVDRKSGRRRLLSCQWQK